MNVMSNHPYHPNPFFSKDWRKHNPWMDGIEDLQSDNLIDEYRKQFKDKQQKEKLEEIKKRVGICVNFPDGIPLDYFIKQEIEKIALMKKKSDNLAVFNEMMGEARGINRVVKSFDK